MNFTLIKFEQKPNVRLMLRQIWASECKECKISSIYKLDSILYILLASATPLCATSVLLHGLAKVELTHLSASEHELFKWAKSEIEQSVEFIAYETYSEYSQNGGVGGRAYIVPNGAMVIRTFERLTEIFGILNYNSDSFSDGGKYNSLASATQRVIELVESGAEIIDVGIESTRPGATVISGDDEIRILKPLLKEINLLKPKYNFLLSIDTYHVETVRWLNDQDAEFINDVSGNLPLDVVRDSIMSGKRYIAMHSLDVPANKQHNFAIELNPLNYLSNWLLNKINEFADNNIDVSKIIFDPGIGFGKNDAQAWYIINNIPLFNKLFNSMNVPILLGHSRKSFLKHIIPQITLNTRDVATSIIAGLLINQVDYLRLHDLTILNEISPVLRACS